MSPTYEDLHVSLIMEGEEDELSPAQKEYYNRGRKEYELFQKRIEEMSKRKDVVVQNNGIVSTMEFMGMLNNTIPVSSVQHIHPGSGNNLILQNPNYYVVDGTNNLAVVMGSGLPRPGLGPVTTKLRLPPSIPMNNSFRSPTDMRPRGRGRGGGTAFRQRVPSPSPNILKSRLNNPMTATRGGLISPSVPQPPPKKSGETVVDLTDEDAIDETNDPVSSRADTKEISINKSSEKTFPSLVVVARPFLSPKEYSTRELNEERAKLDERVKNVLTMLPPQFTEWLLQNGLLRSEQTCTFPHKGKTATPPLKLGMYTDAAKFPFSGGYVWISDCCKSQFISVFTGSIFEGTPHPPTVIIKLIYHWACQTGVQNVIQWVKVDNLYIKNLYTNLRAVCTAAIHQKFEMFGGNGKRVQIGVISLGTTSQDGSTRQVKVEVLGILDESSKMLRIRAIEPIQHEPGLDQNTQMKRRFQKTFELLPKWVHKMSEIVIDGTIDRGTLINFGYSKVTQLHHVEEKHGYKIMEYLRKIIPRMFQNTLSLLSRQIIQQFLDELVWREVYGPIPVRAFDSIIQHLSEQTRLNTGGALLNRLSRISLNPFKNWEYEKWAVNCKTVQAKQTLSKVSSLSKSAIDASSSSTASPPPAMPTPETSVPESSVASDAVKKTDSEMIALEPYYYGMREGDPAMQKYVPFYTQCYICRADFKNAIKLTDHLILHALNKNLDSVSDPRDVCRVCLKVKLPGSKQHHLQMCVPNAGAAVGCKICCTKVKDKGSLVYHMTKTHNELDLPYQCDKCNFRVSELSVLNAHFIKSHSNGISGMCPFCLKVIDFATLGGDDLDQNQIFFIKHIQRHVLPSSKKCSRCLLNFVNKSVLSHHEVTMHASCKSDEAVLRYLVDDPTLMPAPIMVPPLVHTLQPADMKPSGLLKGISTVSLGVSVCMEQMENIINVCRECESPVTLEHFVNYLMCNKCAFRTCCSHAMAEHVSLVHPPYPLSSPVYIGMKCMLTVKAYCIKCDFSSRDGNTMSKHLVTCGGTCVLGKKRPKRPASEVMELQPKLRKRRGRRSRLSTYDELEEEEDNSLSAPSSPRPKRKSVLNVLGLQPTPTDEISQENEEPGAKENPEDEGNEADASAASMLEMSMVEGSSANDDKSPQPSTSYSPPPIPIEVDIVTDDEEVVNID